MKSLSLIVILTLGSGVVLAQNPPPPPAHFTVYSYSTPGNPVSGSHSWAVFERGGERIEISWGPKEIAGTDAIRRPVPGANFDAMSYAKANKRIVHAFGPHKCSSVLFDRAKAWRAKLDSGKVMYVLLDVHDRPSACNCISAVLLAGGLRPITGLRHGPTASVKIARVLNRYYGER